ncbi:EpsG family protein, partial [Marinobacter sp.]
MPYLALLLLYFYFITLRLLVKPSGYSFLYLFAFCLVAFSGLRHSVGTDYWTYVNFIVDIYKGYDSYMEPGFEAMVRIVGEPRFVFFLSSLLTVCGFFSYFKLYPPGVAISLGLFFLLPIFYLSSFNGVRQFIAVGIFLAALRFVVNRRLVLYIFAILLAGIFHKSAILLLPAYFVLRSRYLPLVLVVFSFLLFEMSYLIRDFTIIFGFSDKYFGDGFSNEVNYKSLFVVPVYLWFLKTFAHLRCELVLKTVLVNMMGVSSLLAVVPLLIEIPSSIVLRMSTYFTPAILLLVPVYFYSIR